MEKKRNQTVEQAGVKGMRWGIRRTKDQLDRNRAGRSTDSYVLSTKRELEEAKNSGQSTRKLNKLEKKVQKAEEGEAKYLYKKLDKQTTKYEKTLEKGKVLARNVKNIPKEDFEAALQRMVLNEKVEDLNLVKLKLGEEYIDRILKKKTDVEHWGIPGMKWGRRRSKAQLEKARESRNEQTKQKITKKVDKYSDEKLEYEISKRKSVSELSNKELENYVRRFELEKKYNELNRKPQSAGKKMVTSLAKSLGNQTAKIASDYALQYAEGQALKYLKDHGINLQPRDTQQTKKKAK